MKTLITIFITGAALTSSASAQLAMDWYTVDGGGVTTSSAGTLELGGTIGQHDAGEMGSGSVTLYGGFWSSELLPPPCPADYNQDGGVDGADVNAFFADWENGRDGADVNQDGGIDGADVEYFFQVWERGGC
jgi:hypothetical protein